MIEKKLNRILQKIYSYENSELHRDKDFWTYSIPENLKKSEKELLAKSNFEINQIVHYSHDEVISKAKEIIETTPNLEKKVCNLFLHSLGKGFYRGIQPIFSYYFIKNLPAHKYEKFKISEQDYRANFCNICQIKNEEWDNKSENISDLYIGQARLGGYPDLLVDLEEIITFEDILADKEDIQIFKNLLDCIERAEDKETAPKLVKRISKEKILPNSNDVSRTWTIKCLAELGILKNPYQQDYSIMNSFYDFKTKNSWEEDIMNKVSTRLRIEMQFPYSAWRGALGINREFAEKIIENADVK